MTPAQQELIATKRNIALGKIDAFYNECHRLAELVQADVVTVADAVDTLVDADVANDLSATFGADLVQSFMTDAFATGIFGLPLARAREVAA